MTELLENLIIRPESPDATVTGDLLSDVLSQIRLTGDHVVSQALAAGEELDVAPQEAHVAVVTAGALQMASDDSTLVKVDADHLLLFPRGCEGFRLVASDSSAKVVVCRFLFDPDSLRGMIFALPPCIHLRPEDGGGWIEGIAHFLLLETSDVQPGAALMISRLIDLIVIRALRTWVHQGQTTGWLGGLADPRIARALKVIHQQPMQRWSVPALADIANMSRSSFCERFAALVGRSPLRYQNEWRLGLAREMLARRDARIGEIGMRIGYVSEAAFSRAYKELFGHSPRTEYARREASGGR
ncbi:AraC family transcriptional regulator [Mesorhizobium sp. BR1-1-16]|uniref:AraC family transcriptional regulator n=1 Tax=Mesorhizobium sp. BR1-1-16 TaxID=2876653 RepID=UPI001CCF248B|nr:AraC family transcriptional regulator [Mesorhizobium sp. BR1-1-16]MBZ9934787.1 AraC family transcriptional regulator [Mesorhizobium sp. BR1-1-16]